MYYSLPRSACFQRRSCISLSQNDGKSKKQKNLWHLKLIILFQNAPSWIKIHLTSRLLRNWTLSHASSQWNGFVNLSSVAIFCFLSFSLFPLPIQYLANLMQSPVGTAACQLYHWHLDVTFDQQYSAHQTLWVMLMAVEVTSCLKGHILLKSL